MQTTWPCVFLRRVNPTRMLVPHPSAFEGTTASTIPQVLHLAAADECSTDQPRIGVSAAKYADADAAQQRVRLGVVALQGVIPCYEVD